MDKKKLIEFVNQVERLSNASTKEEYVQDEAGEYLKYTVLEKMVSEARELIKYGEYKIALENILENIHEASISLDEGTITLAKEAFGDPLTVEARRLLCALEQPKV